MKAAILVGGQGKRLRPLTSDKPKTLIEVGGRPIIEWEIEWLKSYGIKSFVILAGYMKDRLIEHLGDGGKFGVEIEFVIEEKSLGRGGALKNAEESLYGEKEFLAMNGDIITNLSARKLSLKGGLAAISLTPLRSTYGVVNVNRNRITGFVEKPLLKDHWMNAGVYLLSNKIFKYLPEVGDIEDATFPKLAAKRLLTGIKYDNVYWRSIDSVKDVEEVNEDLVKKRVY